MGGLIPSSDMLRLIEEIHGDNDAQMQSSFQVYDSCSGIRKYFSFCHKKMRSHNFDQVALMNARLLPTPTNAAVTSLQQLPMIFSHALKETTQL
jgi:hypothetical protein